MPKEKNFNPVAAQRKADKAREIKKGKTQLNAQRNEKLARRNPERLQRQIDELKEAEASGTPLRPRDREVLAQLEKDVKAINKAREALGDNAPTFSSSRRFDDRNGDDRRQRFDREERGRGGGMLGKRRRDGTKAEQQSDSSETDEDVRGIPMPRDTPPPIPRTFRKHNRGHNDEANTHHGPHALPAKPSVSAPVAPVAQAVYSSAPRLRNLQKESTSRFVPAAVKKKLDQVRGEGNRLLEPEELDRLEKEGYADAKKAPDATLDEIQNSTTEQRGKEQSEDAREASLDPEDVLLAAETDYNSTLA